MSLPSAATSFDGGATYYYGGGGSPPFSLVYFLVRLSLLLLLWLLQSSRHDEIRKQLSCFGGEAEEALEAVPASILGLAIKLLSN